MRNVLIIIGILLLGWSSPGAAAPKGSPWGANYFPNVPLITQDGAIVRFYDDLLKDRVVIINFIYTSCTESCPLETAKLMEVNKILGDRVGDDVFIYSISIDPKHDTPEVLKQYAKKFDVGPGWLFLTGDEEDIRLIRRKLGLYQEDLQQQDGKIDHNLTMMIGNEATGRWMKRSPFENPHFLAMQVGDWLHNWTRTKPKPDSYAKAPELRRVTNGERLFRSRCAACHTIGGGDMVGVDKVNVGPDLLGVTQRREESWLRRWIMEPDKMLAEKDPIAMGLFNAYNQVAMPNGQLGEIETKELIDYLRMESQRASKHQPHTHVVN